MKRESDKKPEMKPGTYWDGELRRYVEPEDNKWSAEAYERIAGHPWKDED